MSATNGIRAGAAYVELFLNDSRLTKGLKAAQKQLGDWGKAIRHTGLEVFAAGSATVGALLGAAKAAASMGSQLVEVAERTGMTTSAVQQLQYAANQAGVGFEGLETGLGKMEKTIGDAEMAGDQSIQTFTRLGVSVQALKGMSPDKQFETLAQAISQVEDPAKRSLFAMQIFGRGGLQLLPLMLKGAAGIQTLRKEASSLGLVLSDDDVRASKAFEGKLKTLWQVINVGVFAIGSTLMPILTDLINKVVANVKAAADWIKSNSGLIVSALKIGAAIAFAGATLVVLGTLFSAGAAVIGGIIGTLSAVGTAIGVVGTIVGTILSPIGLVVAAVVGLGAVIAYQTGAAGKSLDFLSGVFGVLKSDAMTAFDGIRAALGNGDIALAAKILWATLKLEFNRGVAWLKGIWIDATSFMSSAWTEATFGFSKILIKATAAIEAGWNETTAFLSDAWNIFTTGILTAFNETVGFIEKAWNRLKGLFDEGFDVKTNNAQIDAEVAAKNKTAHDARDKALIKSDDARKKRGNEINADEQGALGALEQDRQNRQAQILAGEALAETKLATEVAQLQKQLDGLRNEAKNAGRTGPLANYSSGGDGENGKSTPKLPEAGELAKSSSGTFSTIGAAHIGSGGGPMAEVAENTKHAAKWAKIQAENFVKRSMRIMAVPR